MSLEKLTGVFPIQEESVFPNGTVQKIDAGGKTMTLEFDDGIKVRKINIKRARGLRERLKFFFYHIVYVTCGALFLQEVYCDEFRQQIFPDGSCKTVYTDGTQETRRADGSVRVKNKAVSNARFIRISISIFRPIY